MVAASSKAARERKQLRFMVGSGDWQVRERAVRVIPITARFVDNEYLLHSTIQSALWLPSQKGGFLVCLQLHSQTFFASGRLNFFGPSPLPL